MKKTAAAAPIALIRYLLIYLFVLFHRHTILIKQEPQVANSIEKQYFGTNRRSRKTTNFISSKGSKDLVINIMHDR